MKRILTLVLLCVLSAQIIAQEKNINSFISYGTFNVTDNNSPYLETYITFDCSSLTYIKQSNGQYEAAINLTVLFKQGESIKNYDKYTVTSPQVADTANIDGFFMDIQRYSLPNGEYQMEVTIEDANNIKERPLNVNETIIIDFPENICFSSIIALENYKPSNSESAKNGYELIPMIMPYYPESVNKLTFYTEVYNTKKQLGENEKYLLNTYIKTFESNTVVSNYFFTKRMNVKDTEVIINTIDISNLPSGNYYLALEARNRNNEIIGYNQFFFQRSNSNYQIDNSILASIAPEKVFSGNINNLDTIREYIRSLEAISSQIEKEYAFNLVKTNDIETMQQYFYSFWASRNALSPKEEWEKYYVQVKRVNASFSAHRLKGYQTDRGIVFLKYGAPDRIVQNQSKKQEVRVHDSRYCNQRLPTHSL